MVSALDVHLEVISLMPMNVLVLMISVQISTMMIRFVLDAIVDTVYSMANVRSHRLTRTRR